MDLVYWRKRLQATRDLFRRRCGAPYPGETRRPLVCRHWRGHDGPHAASPAIVWDDPALAGGHVYPLERRRR